MKQPKTLQEYRALPQRSLVVFRTIVTDDGRIVKVPIAQKAQVLPFEADTVISDGYTILAIDEDGLYRRPL